MSFSIEMLPERVPPELSEAPAQFGRIELGTFRERFMSLTTFWSADDYRAHWRAAVGYIVETGRDACLITSLHDPAESDLLFWWPMYRIDEKVCIRSGMLLFEQLDRPFRIDDAYTFVRPREVHTTEDEPVSEWEVSIEDLRAFLDR